MATKRPNWDDDVPAKKERQPQPAPTPVSIPTPAEDGKTASTSVSVASDNNWVAEIDAALVEPKKTSREAFIVRLDPTTKKRLDKARGVSSRSKFISELIKAYATRKNI